MRDGSDRHVIFDADSLCTKDIVLYEQHRPHNNSPLSLARMDARGAVIRFLDAVIITFAITALYDAPVGVLDRP